MPVQVAVLGSLHLDYLISLPYIPRKGETLKGRDLTLQAGGKGANQAFYSALQGVPTYMIGRIGSDSMGEIQKKSLVEAGVNVDHLKIDASAKSGMSVAMICDDSDYGAAILSGANMNVGIDDVEAARNVICGSSCLVMQYEIPLPVVAYAARMARAANVKVIVNAAPAYEDKDILNEIDILIVNEIEAEMLLGIQPGDRESMLRQLKETALPPVRIVTLGSEGIIYASPDGSGYIPPHKVPVKDAHGAGDSFVGAFSAHIALGHSLEDALTYGNAAAAVSVTHAGPRSLVTPEKVHGLLNSLK